MYTGGDQFSCTQVLTGDKDLSFAETGNGATAFANPVSGEFWSCPASRFVYLSKFVNSRMAREGSLTVHTSIRTTTRTLERRHPF
jgi:hypothetical protein